MSLMERVAQAGNEFNPLHESQGGPVTLVQLRGLVHERFPSEELARMVEENPTLAENEIRSICRGLFDADAVPGMARMGEARRDALVRELIDGVFGFGPLEPLLAACVNSLTAFSVSGRSSPSSPMKASPRSW